MNENRSGDMSLMLHDSSSRDRKNILWVATSLMIVVSIIILALTI